MTRLILLSGSRNSTKAEKLLNEEGISFERVEISEALQLSEVERDLGIRKLPAVVSKSAKYQGIKEIERFVQTEKR